MRQSFRVGSVFGITIKVHVIFVVLFGLLLIQRIASRGLEEGIIFAALFSMLFGFVLLHELGHSLAAQAHGIRVYDIILWPLGGLARLGRMPDDPLTEFRIAIAGPAVNFALAILLTPLHFLLPGSTFVMVALYVNIAMGAFNLIPAFPLDGGRIFRALLARKLSYLRATRAAVHVGRSFAVVLGLAALASPDYVSVVFISVFVWLVGGQELRMAEARQSEGSVHWGGPHATVLRSRRSAGAERFLSLSGRSESSSEMDRRVRQFIEKLKRLRR